MPIGKKLKQPLPQIKPLVIWQNKNGIIYTKIGHDHSSLLR